MSALGVTAAGYRSFIARNAKGCTARHTTSGRVQKGQWVRQRKPARGHETKKRVSRCHHPGSCANLEDEELHEEPHEAQDQRVRERRRQVRNRRKITVRNQFPYRFRVLASRKQEPVRLWPHVQPGQAAPDHRSGCIERPLHVLHRFLSHVGAATSQSHTLMSTSDTFNVAANCAFHRNRRLRIKRWTTT
jgi:hypothetical protein